MPPQTIAGPRSHTGMAQQVMTSYPTAAEWAHFAPWIPPEGTGRPRQHDLHIIMNAILYVLRAGCAWRLLPKDFPPWSSVYYYFRKWRDDGTWTQLLHALRRADRQRVGRAPEPTVVHPADIQQDRDGAYTVLDDARSQTTQVKYLWADMAYRGDFVAWAQAEFGWTVEIVQRVAKVVGFVV